MEESSGAVVWITGLSGAGKTTLSAAVRARLRRDGVCCLCLDGDMVRDAMGGDLGYREADRMKQIRRIQRLAGHLSDQGLVVIVAALYCHPELLAWNRERLPRYVEVYLRASLEALRRRDSRGVYRQQEVVGLDIPWHAPPAPDLTLDTDQPEAPDVLADRVVAAVKSRWTRASTMPGDTSRSVAGSERNP